MNSVSVDEQQIAALAEYLRLSERPQPFDFCSRNEGFLYPERNRPGVLDLFFFACAHQFGFWSLADEHWEKPMIAPLDGHNLKGSDFLWRAVTRAWQQNPHTWAPETLRATTDAQLNALFHADTGINPLPMWPEHRELIQRYSRWFAEHRTTPTEIMAQAHDATHPLKTLLATLAQIPGYAEDPLQKKAMLLAIVLENRPEHFLPVTDPESAVPIIDYHLQRSALRTGLIRITEPALRAKLDARALVTPAEENAVRRATYTAIEKLIAASGLSAAAVDWFFFQNRTRCPEVTSPDCSRCPIAAICARETRLFQPVLRTTAY